MTQFCPADPNNVSLAGLILSRKRHWRFVSWTCSASMCSTTSSRLVPLQHRRLGIAPGSTFQGMANITAAQAQQIASLAFLGSSSNTGPFADLTILQLADLAGELAAVRSPRLGYLDSSTPQKKRKLPALV